MSPDECEQRIQAATLALMQVDAAPTAVMRTMAGCALAAADEAVPVVSEAYHDEALDASLVVLEDERKRTQAAEARARHAEEAARGLAKALKGVQDGHYIIPTGSGRERFHVWNPRAYARQQLADFPGWLEDA